MKNIRNNKVNSFLDIYHYLCIESDERAKFFFAKTKEIGDRELVKDFWNLLVEHGKYDKKFGVLDFGDTVDFQNWLALAFGGLTIQQILSQNGQPVLSALTSLGVIASDAALFVNNFYNQPKARQIQDVIEAMLIKEPELYDIELCFNKVDMEAVKNTKYEGKIYYKNLHEQYIKLKKQCKEKEMNEEIL